MGKIITVVTGKGNMGKTTMVAAISSCLALLGNKTLCMDLTKGAKKLGLSLGIANNEGSENAAVDHIDVLSGQGEVVEACTKHPRIPNLYHLSPSTSLDLSKFDDSFVKPMFSEIRREFDYCIIDTPSISSPGFKLAHADADMMIIVTSGKVKKMKDVREAIACAQDFKIDDIKIILNCVHPEKTLRIMPEIAEIANETGASLIGQIPNNVAIVHSLQSESPLVLPGENRISPDFLNVAQKILCFTDPLPESKPPQPSSNEVAGVSIEETTPLDDTSKFLGTYGDPKLWAQSTLINANFDDLIEVYAVVPSFEIPTESIRNRMWLHDLLDDMEIPYYIEAGRSEGSKITVDAQHIFVENKNAATVSALIMAYNSSDSIVKNIPDEEDETVFSDDGIPQKKCPSCGEYIDFDYYVCPHCKESLSQ